MIDPNGGPPSVEIVATTKHQINNDFETRAGRLLWKFDLPTIDTNVIIAFTPDEKTIAIARPDLRAWELRDIQTGQIIRTLPLVPATECAAFSPDGAALYCVAGGTLYRQRAR